MTIRRPGRVWTALLFGAATLLPAAALAQTPAGPPPEREGSADFAFVGTSGNSSTQSIGLGGEFIYRPETWETRVRVRYIRNKADDILSAETLTFGGRAQKPITRRLSGYGQYDYLRDRFAGVANRNALEAGVVFTVTDQSPQKLTVDAGLGYANERRLIGDNLSTATFGTGGVYTLKLSGTSELSEDGHLVCSLSEGRDWRFANTAAVTAKITTIFSLRLSNTVRYVNFPVAGFGKTDTATSIALVAKF